MTQPSVAVIGLGEIGAIAVRGLVDAGVAVVVYDIDGGAVRRALAEGATAVPRVRDLAQRCSIVLVAVADGAQVREVCAELLPVMTSGDVLIHSTVGPRLVRELAVGAAPDVTVLDAPVSLRRTDDLPRCLAFLGADEPIRPDVGEVMDCYCYEVALVGRLGAGQVAKLANNVMSIVNTAAAAEALRLAETAGIEVDLMRALAMHGSGDSHALHTWSVRADLFGGDPDAGRRQRALAAKDLAAALDYAAESGVALPLAGAALGQLT